MRLPGVSEVNNQPILEGKYRGSNLEAAILEGFFLQDFSCSGPVVKIIVPSAFL